MDCLVFACLVIIQTGRSQAGEAGDDREGRGVEDLGIGYCHTLGVGWNGNLTVGDVVELEVDQVEANRSSQSVSSDPAGKVSIYWTRLVQRPKCVDRLEISMGSGVQVLLMDPADSEVTQEKVRILRRVCETEALNIKVHNKRGGSNFNINLGNSNVNLVKTQKDENFELNAELEGIVENPWLFINNASDLQFINRTKNELLLVWNKELFTRPLLQKCLTSAELVDEKGNLTTLDISSSTVPIKAGMCGDTNFTVKYKYKGETFLTRNVEIPEDSNCFHSKPSDLENKEMKEAKDTAGEPSPGMKTTGPSATDIGLVILLIIVILGVALAVFLYKRKLCTKHGGYQLEGSTTRGGEGITDSTGSVNVAVEESEGQDQNNEL
eukprot:GFUD01033415.1.p1 GENE.GFUD01033415.1~~GFUD01033415.1.p1  ORF type:complete len:399 (+),score=105.35 GFUD01033415.1:57-1199(+)